MRKRKYRTFSADFETTVYEGQTSTEVWAAASVELYTEDVLIFHSIGELLDYYISLKENIIVYFHNLKFDGTFWLTYFMADRGYKQAFDVGPDGITGKWRTNWEMENNTFKYSIASMGQWYSVTLKIGGKLIVLRDSLKLLPFSVAQIGDAFKTAHRKLNMEYVGLRYAGCPITPQEAEYIANDVLVVKEALEIMFQQGHDKVTIGSCCLSEFKSEWDKDEYEQFFPNLYEDEIDIDTYGAPTVGAYIHNSYKGGWCYLVKGKENRLKRNGTTADVNSLYPSMMHSESGNDYPIGHGTMLSMRDATAEMRFDPYWFQPEPKPKRLYDYGHFYFLRIRTRFYLKKGKLPFVQIKGTLLYKGTEMLESSDITGKDGKPYSEYYDRDGNLHDTRVTLTLTQTDFILLREHYNLVDYELLDMCRFDSTIGIFDDYINKYAEIKKNSKGAMRTLAKLFLNNLYGKMAASMDSSFKVAFLKDDGSLGFYEVRENEKTPGYIAAGSAITSYARNFTIRAAQHNYYGPDKPGFIYADTDSIHCDLEPERVKGIKVHPVDFCCWKLESCWDFGWFSRQKTYIEHVTHEDLERIDEPYYNVRCAGMGKKCKKYFTDSFDPALAQRIAEGKNPYNPEETLAESKLSPEAIEFLSTTHTIEDFKQGLMVPGKLVPKRIKGGTLLVETYFTMR